MQAVGIVSVIASGLVAVAATLVAARTQVRLRRMEQEEARLAELRSVVDSAAQAVVRAQFVLADEKAMSNEFGWDRDFWLSDARLRVHLGPEAKLYGSFQDIWAALNAVKKGHEGPDIPDDEAVDLWQDVHEKMDDFFERTSVVLGPDRHMLAGTKPHPVRDRIDALGETWRYRRRVGRSRKQNSRRSTR